MTARSTDRTATTPIAGPARHTRRATTYISWITETKTTEVEARA